MLTVGVFGITLTYISELSEELVVVVIVVWGETVPNENESNFEAAKCTVTAVLPRRSLYYFIMATT